MTQLPLGLYERLRFFVSPVPLPGQLALAAETPLLAPKDRDLAPKSLPFSSYILAPKARELPLS